MYLPDPRMIDTPAGRLAYRRGGEGPPLLLIHGWGGSSRHWLGAYALLADRHDLIALDLPGFGESPPARGPTSLATMTSAALALCDTLGLARLSVAGHSLGAAVGLLLGAGRPALVARLALASFGLPRSAAEAASMGALHLQLSAAVALWSPWLTLWSPWLAATRPLRTAFWTTPPLPQILAARVVHSLPGVPHAALALGAADLAAMDARAAAEAATTMGDRRVLTAVDLVTAPTLVVSGHQDPLFPSGAARALADALPHGGLLLLDGCGHVPMAEAPGPFYGALGAFLAA